MNLILTGCAGFLGINFLKTFYEKRIYRKYEKIISIDKLSYPSHNNLKSYRKLCREMNIENIDKNILDIEELNIGKCIIFNFASESHVDNSIKDPVGVYEENTLIVPKLMNLVKIENIIRFIHISTDEVFGELESDFVFNENNINKGFEKNRILKPSNPYSASKASQEMYLYSMKHTFSLNCTIIRLSNQYGNHQHHEKFVPCIIKKIYDNNPITIHGDGENKRQWTFVNSSIKILIDILTGKINEDFIHISDKNGLKTNNEVVEIIKNIFEEDLNISSEVKYINDRLGNDKCYFLYPNKTITKYFKDDCFIYNIKNIIKEFKND